ncbi:hypothetical protein BKI51_02520 [Alphaproteobacteria bacterium AO1-B]|nr:hypothetical protein BKI51_02520 [Alphaproteobacteria bacterium AO1-B]
MASRGSFLINDQERTAFVVGSRAAPIEVQYAEETTCTEIVLPAWAGTAVLGVSGRDLSHHVHNISDLKTTPFLSAVTRSGPEALNIAKLAYMNWSAGRGAVDARVAQRVWHELYAEPTRRIGEIASFLGVSDRRVRASVKEEAGLARHPLKTELG